MNYDTPFLMKYTLNLKSKCLHYVPTTFLQQYNNHNSITVQNIKI